MSLNCVGCNRLRFLVCFLSALSVFCQPDILPEDLIVRHPYMVNVRGFGESICSGVLLGEFTVVTAARCVDPRSGREGRPTLWLNATQADEVTEATVVRETVETLFHPNYTSNAVDGYDIAMLRLNESSGPLRPMRILPPASVIPLVGRTLLLLSFGRTSLEGSRTIRLQISQLEVVEPEQCINADIGYLEDQMFCVDRAVPCAGDFGGPLFYGRTSDAEALFGVVSGTSCFENIELSGITNTATEEAIAWLRSVQAMWEQPQDSEPAEDDEDDVEIVAVDTELMPELDAEGPDVEDYYEILDLEFDN